MKRLLKSMLLGLALFCALPSYLFYRLQCLFLPADRVFAGWSQGYSLLPGLSGEFLRAGFYRLTLEGWGRDCQIQFGTVLSRPEVRLCDGVSIGSYCSLGTVEIGENTIVGTGVHIPSGTQQHGFDRLDVPIKEQTGRFVRINIGQDCWLGNGCIVMADVGDHCVIGAGSVVTKPVEDYAIVAGNPARVIRRRDGRPGSSSDPCR
jgi:acetyltransferase-like isoleucine patch superfamily enzyme